MISRWTSLFGATSASSTSAGPDGVENVLTRMAPLGEFELSQEGCATVSSHGGAAPALAAFAALAGAVFGGVASGGAALEPALFGAAFPPSEGASPHAPSSSAGREGRMRSSQRRRSPLAFPGR